MTLDSTIRLARQRQAVQFSARATILRPIGEPTYDAASGEVSQPTKTLYTDRPCKVSNPERVGLDVQAGETNIRLTDREVKFAVDTDVAIGDVVVLTASTYNPLDVGVQLRITDIDRREWQISRRCSVEETQVPMLWDEESS